MKARLISVQCVHLTASFWYKTNLWWNERKLKMRVKTSGAKCIIYNNPHCYSLWTANLLVSKERGTLVKQKKTGLGILKGLPFLLGLNLTHGAEKLTTLWAEGFLEASNGHPSSCQTETTHTSIIAFCITKNQDNTQIALGCALTLHQTIFLKLEFYLLASVFTVLSSCSGIQVRSKVQAVACLQVSPDLMQVGILPSLVPWKWTENVFWRHLENGFRYYYYVELQRDNLWP